MQDADPTFAPDLSGLGPEDWQTALAEIGAARGFHAALGSLHQAVFVESGDTLLVTFENADTVRGQQAGAVPLGFDMVREHGWSHLCLLSAGDTWFRANAVYGFFDQLSDDGFFDDFETVVFYGAGPGGYAAAAYSVASPGARVMAVQPQATLDPRVTEWDDRFVEMRRISFTNRYGYAPDMLDAAAQAVVLYDQYQTLDAMHAALFTRSNVDKLRMPFMGGALQDDLQDMDLTATLLLTLAEGKLDTLSFAQLLRARRNHAPYLRRLLAHLDAADRPGMALRLCRNVVARMNAPRFRRRLAALEAALDPSPDPDLGD